jgi:hypothetical protein
MTNSDLVANNKSATPLSRQGKARLRPAAAGLGYGSFVIPSSLIVDHWSLLPRRHSSFRRIALLLVALLMFGACQKRLSKANVEEVTTGMSRKQVESILGSPTSIDSTDLLITKKVTYVYRQDNESVTIVFFNDQVSSKESNLHD